ncbi:hypothetical protein CAEBREN_11000 [Caenorhabditis brenneri]|uniref:Uncharacterized protein n=1 Tax=Caenorhabditis brenneri TaxID=135651 RepID=G0NXF9_CAEBE|nr:hypothetical protein CAEBREN_11000 [Caenorhabditis brenneri]
MGVHTFSGGTGALGNYVEVKKNDVKKPKVDQAKIVSAIENSTVIADASIPQGMLITPPPWNDALEPVSEVGAFLATGVKLKEPTKLALKALAQKLKQLEVNVNSRYDEMEEGVSSEELFMQLIGDVSILKKFMADVLDQQNKEVVQNFQRVYTENQPLTLAYTLMSILSPNSTSPLAKSFDKMEKSDRDKVIESFQKFVFTLVGDLLLIEAFASGLIKTSDFHDFERLVEVYEDIQDALDEWDEKFNKGAWEDFKKNFPNLVRKLENEKNEKKAVEIRRELEKKCPNHAFYVCVFNKEATVNKDFFYQCADSDQLVEVRNEGNCNAFVYRSQKAKRMAKSEFEKTIDGVLYFYSHKKAFKETMESSLKEGLLPHGQLRTDGLIALVNYEFNPIVHSVNSPTNRSGPGSREVFMMLETPTKKAQTVMLIVGMP